MGSILHGGRGVNSILNWIDSAAFTGAGLNPREDKTNHCFPEKLVAPDNSLFLYFLWAGPNGFGPE